MISSLVEETNRYALQQKSLELKYTCKEIEQFLGILLLMGIVKLPHMSMYWETATRYPPVADTMVRYRFKNIRQFFQVNDSSKAVRKGNAGYDPLFKVRPLVVK
ncbi:hypothetical protein QYM36_012484 [Artemia franciscana]|uniref:PiggyBac transposable element-derived protein domain-containing protein n=1 Tax=Artemia franciscana TaxID=6661 RepID=A0AA88HQC0_ARTSF|nr:hypothetical protein QYM36_012484 [Artemia franciscana]